LVSRRIHERHYSLKFCKENLKIGTSPVGEPAGPVPSRYRAGGREERVRVKSVNERFLRKNID
ncbi:MAG TPA: hypothetical protein VEM15_17475, partial [Thermodesulfobacteriota bacterium]|nr:hypothetical protein [Thermodesulfobacteriota bacterium]